MMRQEQEQTNRGKGLYLGVKRLTNTFKLTVDTISDQNNAVMCEGEDVL